MSPDYSGDFNLNGIVDAADYVISRKVMGDVDSYNFWRRQFGTTPASGSSVSRVPEPTSWTILLFSAIVTVARRRRR